MAGAGAMAVRAELDVRRRTQRPDGTAPHAAACTRGARGGPFGLGRPRRHATLQHLSPESAVLTCRFTRSLPEKHASIQVPGNPAFRLFRTRGGAMVPGESCGVIRVSVHVQSLRFGPWRRA